MGTGKELLMPSGNKCKVCEVEFELGEQILTTKKGLYHHNCKYLLEKDDYDKIELQMINKITPIIGVQLAEQVCILLFDEFEINAKSTI